MRKTFLIALALLLLVGGGGYFALLGYADYEARHQLDLMVERLKADGVAASHGAVKYDLFDQRLEVKDLSFTAANGGTLRIAALTASGLDQPAPDRFAASHIELRELALEGPLLLAPGMHGRFDAPLITIADYDGPTELVVASKAPGPLALAYVEATNIGRVDIPAASSTTVAGVGEEQVKTSTTYHGITVEGVRGGKIARSAIASSVFQMDGSSKAARAQGEIGTVSAESVDLGAILVLLDPERRLKETDFRLIYGAITAENYRLHADDGTVQGWASMKLRDVALAPSRIPAEELLAVGARIRELAVIGQQPAADEVADLLTGIAGAYDALRIGGASFQGMSATAPDGATVTLKSMVLGKLDQGRLDTLALEGLEGKEPGGAPFRLDRLALGGLRPGATLRLAAQATLEPIVNDDPLALVRALSLFDSIDITGAQVPVGYKNEPAIIDTLSLAWTANDDGFPTRVKATLRASAPTDQIPNGTSVTLLLPESVSRASIAADISGQWNPTDQTATLDPFYVEVSDSFSLNARARLTHVAPAAFAPDKVAALNALMAANLALVEVKLTDSGLYEQKLEEAAKEQGATPDMLRQLLGGFAEMVLSPVTDERPDFEPAVQALIAFLQKPMGTIALRVTPRADTLPLSAIAEAAQTDPMTLVNQVDIDVVETP